MRSFRIPSFRSTVFLSLIYCIKKLPYCIKKLPSDSATPQTPSLRHLYLKNLASLILSFRVCSIAHPYLVIQTVKITFCLTTVVLNFSKPLTYVSESEQAGRFYLWKGVYGLTYIFFVRKYFPVSLIYIHSFFLMTIQITQIHLKSLLGFIKSKKKKNWRR